MQFRHKQFRTVFRSILADAIEIRQTWVEFSIGWLNGLEESIELP
ncbi:hypothetical protein [Microcoleus sp. FACHB-1515]|nr:hypothetical protein [Microcoleus sp. FACHB-1515]